jgi:phosphoglycerol transferase MdoB-like AlkP superfamily enzyme
MAVVYLAVSAVLRLVLWWTFGQQAEVPMSHLPSILALGALNDAVELLYLFAPFSLYLLIMPQRAFRSPGNRVVLAIGYWLTLFGMVYLAVVEFFFFEEFDARFNLVAVDYLMYPHEVLVNIWESYPVPQVLALAAVAATLGLRALWPRLRADMDREETPLRARGMVFGLHSAALAAAIAGVSTQSLAYSPNRVENELVANGLSSLFQAFHTNELDYDTLYLTHDPRSMLQALQSDLGSNGGEFAADPNHPLRRHVEATTEGLGRLNLVVIVEESFGCEHVDACGAGKGLTPEFDALARQGLFFTKAYATGTRTVRGLEAITASIPPIPSESIVKRPGYESVANWSDVMRDQGYRCSFLYGGFGQFDNMNNFFSSHGYQVIDRSDIPNPRFGNIWGVSDQDLFASALTHFDSMHAAGQPFFSLVMSVSNHKPYTFPAGVEGVPEEGGGRQAGVRYADHALGEFFREAEKRPWYRNTVFVVVADHGARVYGKARIPMYSYHIPLLLLAPGHLAPGRVDRPASQVDIAPTVLALLGLSYEAPFVGSDLLARTDRPDTLMFNHNHDVALYRSGHLAVLGLQDSVATYRYALGDREPTERTSDPDLERLAVAYYQTAFELFQSHRYR